MDAVTPAATMHFYDTRTRAIACGVSGLDHRSTKHPRQVNCRACVALIGERPTMPIGAPDAHAAGAP